MTDEHPYASHAPVFTVDGTRKGELARDVLRLDVEEGLYGLRTFVGRFHPVGPDSDGSTETLGYLDGGVLDFGKELEVTLGPPGGERRIFKGNVSALEVGFTETGTPCVTVFAEDALMELRMTRRVRTWKEVGDADLARQIAGEHGLGTDVAADGPTYPVVQQWNQSDLAFLRDRARLAEAEIWLEDRTLHFASRANRRGPELTLVQGNHLIDVALRADLAHQRSSVNVSGYDAVRREKIDEQAGEDAVSAEVNGGRTGVKLLTQAAGDRATLRVREAPLAGPEARAWARTEMLRRARGFVTADGLTRGSPDLVVGSRLTLERVGRPFEGGGYYATHVHHTYDRERGHRTRFRAERATVNAP